LSTMNTTLDVAEAQAGALRLDRSAVDLSVVVRQMVNLYQPAMEERQHELIVELEENVVVDADWGLLHRVLSNLIENEIGHLPKGCQITVRVRSQARSAELVIEDNGPGFPPEIRARAFERFVRGKQSLGHGLGLAFVDAVVRTHGGTARVSDRPAGGAVITLSLPTSVLHAASR
jgi:signal transduction histidine kinase